MPFRANDYNAFLTSLLDRDQALPGDAPVLPHSTLAPMPPPPPHFYSGAGAPAPLAMDFDFGMMPVSQGLAATTTVPMANGFYSRDYADDMATDGPLHLGPMGADTGAGASYGAGGASGASAQLPLLDPAALPKLLLPKLLLPRPRVKLAHNIIEQRYRNKINDKFNALQMLVPALRLCARRKAKKMLYEYYTYGS